MNNEQEVRRPVHWFTRYFDTTKPTGLLRTIVYIASLVSLVLFGVILETLKRNGPVHQADTNVLSFMEAHRTAVLTGIFERISAIADVKTSILIVFVWAAVLAYRKREKLAAVLVFGTAIQGIVAYGIKDLVARKRPDQTAALVHESSFSFPSGHTMVATVIWGLAAYFIARSVRPGLRWVVLALYALAVLAVAVSRMYLGAHYLSDVTGSILLGGALLCVYLGWITGHPKHLPRELFGGEVVRILLAVFAVIAVAACVVPNLFT